jgi:hypothetical protein
MIPSDVVEGLERAAAGISSMDRFEQALRGAQAEITLRYPLARENVRVIGEQMRNTLVAIAMATSTIPHLELFVNERARGGSDQGLVSSIQEHVDRVSRLDQQLAALRGSSEVIRAHAEAIVSKVGSPLRRLASYLAAQSPVDEADIAKALAEISAGGSSLYDRVYGLSDTVQRGLAALSGELEAVVPSHRAEVLQEYSRAFGEVETRANFACLKVQEVITAYA